MTDAELVRRTRTGDTTAREQLVSRWAPRVLAVCRARIGRHHAAEDLAQETLIRSLKNLSQLERPEQFGSWIRGIAVHVCLDWLRSNSRKPVNSANAIEQSFTFEISHVEQLHERERNQQLLTEIELLPEELREPLLLFYYENSTYEEIAILLGVSKATVNTRLAKARLQLARKLAHIVQ